MFSCKLPQSVSKLTIYGVRNKEYIVSDDYEFENRVD